MTTIKTAVLCALLLIQTGSKPGGEGQGLGAGSGTGSRTGIEPVNPESKKLPKLPAPMPIDAAKYVEEIDMSKPVVPGSCYPHRDNGDGTCTVEIYTRQAEVECRWVEPGVSRTRQLECVYPKPKNWPEPVKGVIKPKR